MIHASLCFSSNLDDNGSNLLLSRHIALTICSVLLLGEPAGFDRNKDFRSNFKENRGLITPRTASRSKTEDHMTMQQDRTAVLQDPKLWTAVCLTVRQSLYGRMCIQARPCVDHVAYPRDASSYLMQFMFLCWGRPFMGFL